MDAERGRKLTERLFEPDGVEPDAASGVVPGAGSGVAQGAGSNSNSKLLLAALAVGLVLVASAGVGREVVNARALAAQVEEADAARMEAEAAQERLQTYGVEVMYRVSAEADDEDWIEALGWLKQSLIYGRDVLGDDPLADDMRIQRVESWDQILHGIYGDNARIAEIIGTIQKIENGN